MCLRFWKEVELPVVSPVSCNELPLGTGRLQRCRLRGLGGAGLQMPAKCGEANRAFSNIMGWKNKPWSSTWPRQNVNDPDP